MRVACAILWLALLGHVGAATYHVTKSGNDTTGDGSVGNPWLTVQKGVSSSFAGDNLLVGSGIYLETVTTARNGTSGARIVIDGQGVATLSAMVFSHQYISLINMTMSYRTNNWQTFMADGGHFGIISNCTYAGQLDGGGNSTAIRWDNPNTSTEPPFGGNINSGALVISNLFTDWRGAPILRVYGDTNIIVGNRFLDNDTTDILHLWGRSNSFIMNLVSNVYVSGLSGSHPDFIQTFGPNSGLTNEAFGSIHQLIESNTVIKMDGDSQLCMFEGHNNRYLYDYVFRNNLFIGVSSKGTMAFPQVHWYNNIFIDCSTNPANAGAVLIFTAQTNATFPDFESNSGHGCHVYNNIFLNCGDGTTNKVPYHVYTDMTNTYCDYNFVASSNYHAVVVDPSMRAVGDPGGWDRFAWWEPNGINGGNPRLINERRKNFRTFVGSPLIGAGTNLSSLFTTDLDGKTRDAEWDIGPYEYLEVPPPALACITEPKAPRAYPIANTNWIAIVWPTNQYRLLSMLSRRAYTNNPIYWSSWVNVYSNASSPTAEAAFVDTNITSGIHYEYALAQLMTNWMCDGVTNGPAWSYQYISTGTDVPLRDNRGKLILLVESGVAGSLTSELATLTNDFIGDGYKVFRHDVASVEVTNSGWFTAVTNTRALVQSTYLTDTNSDWTLFIVGHVPIPYGGNVSPGAHLDNLGAHPADWFYADRNAANWFDVGVNNSTADDPPQWNVPGDGKLDTNQIPNMPQMRLGRLDLNQYPSTGKSSVQLLSQYLARNHQWRHKQFTVPEVSTINFSNSAPAEAHGLLSSFYGTSQNIVLTNWLLYLSNNPALFAYSKGSGNYEWDNSLNNPTWAGYTTNILRNPFYGVFVRTMGSYYGDWDSGMRSNLFLNVFLANEGYALTTELGLNMINMDATAMGEVIGHQMFVMAANYHMSSIPAKYFQVNNLNLVFERVEPYVSLQGDPTLRARQVAPPSSVTNATSGSDIVVSWTNAVESNVYGYHIYRAPASDLNDFTRLTATPTTSPYTDAGAAGGDYAYMVRTVKLEDSDNRSYYNSSQGAFGTLGDAVSVPTIPALVGPGRGGVFLTSP